MTSNAKVLHKKAILRHDDAGLLEPGLVLHRPDNPPKIAAAYSGEGAELPCRDLTQKGFVVA